MDFETYNNLFSSPSFKNNRKSYIEKKLFGEDGISHLTPSLFSQYIFHLKISSIESLVLDNILRDSFQTNKAGPYHFHSPTLNKVADALSIKGYLIKNENLYPLSEENESPHGFYINVIKIMEDTWNKKPAKEVKNKEELNQQLFDAARHNDIEAAKKAIQDGAPINARDKDGETPLHMASRWGHREVAKILIENGAFINARDKDGDTPLHEAGVRGYIEIAALLKQHGGV